MNEYNEYLDFKNRDVWAIGDVHGCYDEFKELIDKIYEESKNPVIFQLGDMIDRGPELYGQYELAHVCDMHLVVGNHEMNFLNEHYGYKYCHSKARQKTHDIFESFDDESKKLILDKMHKSSAYYFVSIEDDNKEKKDFFLTHSPYNCEKFSNLVNVNGWDLSTNGEMDDINVEIYNIHGHQQWNYVDVEKQLKQGRKTINIDSGCCYGRRLTALRLNDFKVIQVEAKCDYS